MPISADAREGCAFACALALTERRLRSWLRAHSALDLDHLAAFGESAEPVVDPSVTHARCGHQVGHRDAMLGRDGQDGPQLSFRVCAASAIAPARRIRPVRAIIGIYGPVSGGCASAAAETGSRVGRRSAYQPAVWATT